MTRYHSTIDVEEENNRVRKCQCHNYILGFIQHYITLTLYYILKDIIQMTSYYSTLDVEEENNRVRKCQ